MNRVIVIDDDKDSCNLLHLLLRRQNYSVEIFSTAEEFTRSASAAADLYIIDINLGGISGVDVCTSLKTMLHTKEKKVLLISAHPEIEKLAIEARADDFLPRPFSSVSLMSKIKSLI